MALVVFITSCAGEAKESVTDGDFTIELLFEKDGCNMYRFRDKGRYIYWSNCQGNTQYNFKSNGKNGRTVHVESFTRQDN
jgi:hypothetical protein